MNILPDLVIYPERGVNKSEVCICLYVSGVDSKVRMISENVHIHVFLKIIPSLWKLFGRRRLTAVTVPEILLASEGYNGLIKLAFHSLEVTSIFWQLSCSSTQIIVEMMLTLKHRVELGME